MAEVNRASPSPGCGVSPGIASSSAKTCSALPSARARAAGNWVIALSGRIRRSAATRKTMVASAESGCPPTSPGFVAAQITSTSMIPPKTSLTGLVSEEYRWVRSTRFRYVSAWRANDSDSRASAP